MQERLHVSRPGCRAVSAAHGHYRYSRSGALNLPPAPMYARDRLKQRMIRDLVRENLDTVAGMPPAGLRRRRRRVSGWLLAALGATLVVGFSGPISSTASRFGRPRVASPVRADAGRTTTPPSALPAPRKIDPALFQLAVSKIVIDPGHGGADPGAVTPSGLEEKAITLDIAN